MCIAETEEGSISRHTSQSLPSINPCLDHVGQYRLVCEIASGGMAAICLGVKRSIGGFEKFVAIKKLHPHLARVPAFAQMFIDEARLTARVAHPYVCNAIDFGKEGEDYYIAMEFLQGKSLTRINAKHRKALALFDEPKRLPILARIFANLAEGIQAIHDLKDEEGRELGVIHRDLTPHNLFVLFDGSVRVTDLGIAYAHEKLHHTDRGFLKGKLSYMAPEQLERMACDQRCDIWSFGVVMWQLLTGYELFRKRSEADTALAVLHQIVEPPSSRDPRIPPALDQIVLKALSRDVDSRYRTMAELRSDLENYLASTGQSVTSADVAAWMAKIFPTGLADTQRLIWLAHQIMINAPEGADSIAPQKIDAPKSSSAIPAMVRDSSRASSRQLMLAFAVAAGAVLGFAAGWQLALQRGADLPNLHVLSSMGW